MRIRGGDEQFACNKLILITPLHRLLLFWLLLCRLLFLRFLLYRLLARLLLIRLPLHRLLLLWFLLYRLLLFFYTRCILPPYRLWLYWLLLLIKLLFYVIKLLKVILFIIIFTALNCRLVTSTSLCTQEHPVTSGRGGKMTMVGDGSQSWRIA